LLSSKVHTQFRLSVACTGVALVLATLACQVDVGGPEPPGPPIEVSPQAAGDLARVWRDALETAATTGEVIVLLDEAQVTSYLAQRLEAEDSPVLHQPQVYLRQGHIQIYGTTRRDPFQARVLVTITPSVSPEGDLSLEIESADFGPLPAPRALKAGVSAILTEAFTGTLGSLATGIRIKSLAIVDGQLAIVGELR
jgi:hypothetical protein